MALCQADRWADVIADLRRIASSPYKDTGLLTISNRAGLNADAFLGMSGTTDAAHPCTALDIDPKVSSNLELCVPYCPYAVEKAKKPVAGTIPVAC